MSEPKKPISHAKEPEPKPDMDKKASSKGGSHVRKRKLRFDRIAAVFVPLLLIVLLIGALCFHSCQRRKQPEDSGNAVVATATTKQTEKATDKPKKTTEPDVATDTTKTTTSTEETSRKDGKQITLAAKGVVRDVGRALDMPYAQCDAIAKMIPGDLGMTLDKALKASPDLREAYESDDSVKYLIDMSKRLEGLPRHTSMHAAGVVISRAAVCAVVQGI